MQKYILGLFLLATSFMSLDSANREIFKSYNDTIDYLLKINEKRQTNADTTGNDCGRLEEIIDCIELVAEKNLSSAFQQSLSIYTFLSRL